jgi:hypothetical protein
VYEWQAPHFYTMLVHEWETTSVWTGQTCQDYKAELLRVWGLNVMSTAEYQMAFQYYLWTFIDVYQCMHDYDYGICMHDYDYGICKHDYKLLFVVTILH